MPFYHILKKKENERGRFFRSAPLLHGGKEVKKELLQIWQQTEPFQRAEELLFGGGRAMLTGLSAPAAAMWLAAMQASRPGALLFVLPELRQAAAFEETLRAFLPAESVCSFPDLELLPFENAAPNLELLRRRSAALTKLAAGEPVTVLCPAEALCRRFPPPELHRDGWITLAKGQRFAIDALCRRLVELGYHRESLVDLSGDFSVRGGIVDIFPLQSERPLRLEFFDDEIESMHYFEAASQRSQEELDSFLLGPASELPAPAARVQKAALLLEQAISRASSRLPHAARLALRERYGEYLELLKAGSLPEDAAQLLSFLYPESVLLTDYLPPSGRIVLLEPERCREIWRENEAERQAMLPDLLESGALLPDFAENFASEEAVFQAVAQRPGLFLADLPGTAGFPVSEVLSADARPLLSYHKKRELLAEDAARFRENGYRLVATASNELRLKKTRELFESLGIKGVEFAELPMSGGFESRTASLALLSEQELWGQELRERKAPRFRVEGGERISSFVDLHEGDYVVHARQGIGRYLGVKRLTVGEISRDYLHIEYAGSDRLFVPVDQLDQVQKYVGNEGTPPKIYKLGGSEWRRTKSKVRASVQDMAAELLRLYGQRQQAKGFAFSPDTPWQGDFEDGFPYAETADQLAAIAEVKKDMEAPRPMDRLLCGDVGYGKTEVALRAAFKAVTDGKQVAVLVPTTVLAEQHYHTFSERMADFTVQVGVLSRFYSAKEQKETLRRLKDGRLDVLIGTHRLLSADVQFHDLGLIVVDEEQRFGVRHKEQLKKLQLGVDVLTLSATPIPRTLHMSLVGMRDVSLITTPPSDRQPVQTYVLEYHPRLIREAISRELARQGQVFVVCNNIDRLYPLADELEEIPGVRAAVGHGQMREHELETVMHDFVSGVTNVLICTTIIESGLDIPNVNTLVVLDADHFGLAQLYQLRGRVGRSHRQAYAYFSYRRDKILPEQAKKRLKAIRDFTELGAGFKIAMRDMEIRGAGNILGSEQHGHIAAVGFDMYCRLIDEEVKRQKGEEVPESREAVQLDLGLSAFLPDSYIPDTVLKVEVYKRLSAAESKDILQALAEELCERYGPLPEPVENLIAVCRVKILAEKLGFASIHNDGRETVLAPAEGTEFSVDLLMRLAKDYRVLLFYRNKKRFEFVLKTQGFSGQEVAALTERVLAKIIALQEEAAVL